ncbi:MAG: GNAT family N-acetyltransferase [Burkholderiales bacterium]|nr:GNAT family N-acetyltransferase [Burkholderiales bacterium]
MRIREGYVPGCIGRIAQLHATYYAAHAGFGAAFEAKVASELAAFCRDYVAGRDGLWLATEGNAIEASVVIDASHHAADGAHLRWFIASDRTRGSGVGTRLLAEALAFCDARGYRTVYLWTFDQLHAARHLYQKHGFRLAHAQAGAQWGTLVNEQRFERAHPALAGLR